MTELIQADDDRRITVRRARVLTVEDDLSVLERLRLVLEPRHEVTCATTGSGALHRIAQGERFHMILCDLELPDFNGLEFLVRLMSISPGQVGRTVFFAAEATDEGLIRKAQRFAFPLLDTARDLPYVPILAGWFARGARGLGGPSR
jgi:CheY-like chemotaxis protein